MALKMILLVLLPGLPLQFWNLQALERIGASLGCFLKVDTNLLEAPDRRLAKIYVEVDIQVGLPEVLEIDWRGQLISQDLDFLGIPFRCSFCRRTGHLRRDCSKFPLTEEFLDPVEEDNFNGYISSPHQPAEVPHTQSDDLAPEDDIVRKIQSLCPSLYNTLSASDRLLISEHAALILLPTFQINPTTPPLAPLASDSSQTSATTTSPEQPSLTSPIPPTSHILSETDPFIDLEDTLDPNALAGFSEPPLSDTQLDTFIRDSPTQPSLPFDSLLGMCYILCTSSSV
jgi:hypothetical protein